MKVLGVGKVLKYSKELNFSFVYILIIQTVNPLKKSWWFPKLKNRKNIVSIQALRCLTEFSDIKKIVAIQIHRKSQEVQISNLIDIVY